MRLLLLVAVLFSAACAAVAGAPAHSPPACTAERATPASIEAVQANFDAWRGKCVKLRGIVYRGRLLVDREAVLEPGSLFDEKLRRSIILYPSELPKPGRPARAEVIGAIGSCADQNAAVSAMRDEQPGQIIMVGGYCHTSLANYVRPVAIQVVDRRPVPRLTEAEVPLAQRQFVAMPGDIPGYAQGAETGRALITALATGDADVFLRLTDPEAWDERRSLDGRGPPPWLAERLAAARRDFARLRASGSSFAAIAADFAAREHVFISRDDLAFARENPRQEVEPITCWCKSASCAGRWPVFSGDADNAPARPYVCVRTGGWVLDGKTVPYAKLEASAGGFAEPRWPR